jgi:dihydropteroate synthase
MGIVNVTPDSFSDGGRYADVESAVAHGLQLVAEGAEILDVGGESTRPYAEPVPLDEELERVGEVVRLLAARAGVPISIDTSKAAVAARAIEQGAEIVNDVTGLEGDPGMLGVVVESGVAVCAMHMQGTPQSMQIDPRYGDVVAEIHGYLEARRDALRVAGLPLAKICLDPGIGFGKTHAHNRTLMAHADRFLDLGTPILVGHSRKGFIGRSLEAAFGHPPTLEELDAGTAGAACGLAARGIQIVRVHAVGQVCSALELFATMSG